MRFMRKTRNTFWKKLPHLCVEIGLGATAVFLVIAGFLLLWVASLEMPDLSAFENRQIQQSTKIYDRTGETLLYDLNKDIQRTVIPYEDISRHIKNATIAIEDDTFFEHRGVRPLAIVRAALSNLREGDLLGGQGGSTITQQVIKNALLVPDKTITRKVKEAILALRLESELSKEEILAHYLNESPYGGTIYGVEEASQKFFGKSATDVTLAEAAYLAALPKAPTYFSPYGSNRDELEARKNLALARMRENGFITEEEYSDAKNTEVTFLPRTEGNLKAPHFVMYVREQLAREFGEAALNQQGLRVITTLDYELQKEAERIVRENALRNKEEFNAENAALVAVDPRNGEILTLVGSRDYFDTEIDGNFNVALAKRQPGSAFKPFVYAAAFERGYTPATTLFDLPTQFSTTCAPNEFTSEDGCYAPQNYDGEFRGPVSMRNALAQSLNIPAVKTLYLSGVDEAVKLARDAGINTLTNPDRLGLTLVLGGGEVKLLELVASYGAFATEGISREPIAILRVEDRNGNVLKEYQPNESRAFSQETAARVSDILADNRARAPLYGSNSLLYFGGRDVAAKTGTTNDYRDAWIVGYTPNLVVGAWAGNNDNSAMAKRISGLIITPLWREFMDVALPTRETEVFRSPQPISPNLKPVLRSNGKVLDVAALTDALTTPDGDDSGDLTSLAYNQIHSILHYVRKDDPRGAPPTNPASDPQYRLWEYGVTQWKNNRFRAIGREDVVDDEEPVTQE